MAISWIITKGYIPIPGTKKRKYIEQNIEATQVSLSQDELNRLESIVPLRLDTGNRYDDSIMKNIDMK